MPQSDKMTTADTMVWDELTVRERLKEVYNFLPTNGLFHTPADWKALCDWVDIHDKPMRIHLYTAMYMTVNLTSKIAKGIIDGTITVGPPSRPSKEGQGDVLGKVHREEVLPRPPER